MQYWVLELKQCIFPGSSLVKETNLPCFYSLVWIFQKKIPAASEGGGGGGQTEPCTCWWSSVKRNPSAFSLSLCKAPVLVLAHLQHKQITTRSLEIRHFNETNAFKFVAEWESVLFFLLEDYCWYTLLCGL